MLPAAFVFGVICLCLPLLAFVVLNQDWEIYIAVIDLYYKPWRLFLVICGLLSAICGTCMFFLPESPKFVFTSVSLIVQRESDRLMGLLQGDEAKTLKILEKIYRINNCSGDGYNVNEILKDSDYTDAVNQLTARQECCFFETFKLMWKQTAPLFQGQLLKNTLIACSVQFMIFVTSNG